VGGREFVDCVRADRVRPDAAGANLLTCADQLSQRLALPPARLRRTLLTCQVIDSRPTPTDCCAMQPPYQNPPYPEGFPVGAVILAVGIIGLVLGFAILRWITRDPEDGPDSWRSHRRR
jgi:hypothetical protein